ncbi:MAG TPA: DUF4395 domain-containing protein [Chlorobaculum sp.]|jgi:hypothetical protein|nr:DUF4395 domain-containing protein [Chlorobaculum sp.]
MSTSTSSPGIPLPIVKFNRWLLLGSISTAIVIQQPIITSILFVLLFPAVVFGRKASPIFLVGSKLFAEKNQSAPTEDAGLMRFNNSIALILLGGAQIAFIAGAPIAGWILSGFVAVAAAVALSGFCFGCFLYYQFNLQRYRLFGQAGKKCDVADAGGKELPSQSRTE